MPPPPPPPPAPSGLPKAPKIKSGGGGTDRAALLTSIQGGARLKKTVTNDRSAPMVAGNKRSSGGNKFNTVAAPARKPPTRDLPGTWRGSKDDGNSNRPSPPSSSGGGGGGGGVSSNGPSGGGPMGLGGLFAAGMPQLRKTGANTGGGPPKRLAMPVPGSGNKPANNGPAARFGQNNTPAPGPQNGRRMVNGVPPNAFPPPPPPQDAKPGQNVAPPPPPSQDCKPNRPLSGVRRTESIENDKNVSRNPQTIAGVINRGQPPPPPTRPVPTSNTNGRPSSMVGRPLPPTPPSVNGSAAVAPTKVAPPPPPRQQPGRPSAPPPPVRNTSMQQRPPPPPRQDPPPPPPHMGRPPPPPMSQPPSATRSRSSVGSHVPGGDNFEQRFKFHSLNEFPHPEKPNIGVKTYPSHTKRPSQQRRAPPPPPPPR